MTDPPFSETWFAGLKSLTPPPSIFSRYFSRIKRFFEESHNWWWSSIQFALRNFNRKFGWFFFWKKFLPRKIEKFKEKKAFSKPLREKLGKTDKIWTILNPAQNKIFVQNLNALNSPTLHYKFIGHHFSFDFLSKRNHTRLPETSNVKAISKEILIWEVNILSAFGKFAHKIPQTAAFLLKAKAETKPQLLFIIKLFNIKPLLPITLFWYNPSENNIIKQDPLFMIKNSPSIL